MYPSPGERVGILLEFLYALTARGDRVGFNVGYVAPPPTPPPIRLSMSMPYSKAAVKRTLGVSLNYADSANVRQSTMAPWSDGDLLRRSVDALWGVDPILKRELMLAYSALAAVRGAVTLSSWMSIPVVTRTRVVRWAALQATSRIMAELQWLAPEQKRYELLARYSTSPERRRLLTLPWLTLSEIKRLERKLPWREGRYPSWLVLPEPLPPVPPVPIPHGERVGFNLRCPSRTSPGHRVGFNLGSLACASAQPTPGMIVVINTAYMKRLPDNVNIAVTRLRISANEDEFCWSLSADVSHAALGLIVPNVDGPIEVEVGVNGYVWRFIVDDWDEDEQRQDRARERNLSITGRSVTALLHKDFARKRSRVNSAVRTSQQLIDDELTYLTGYTCDYGTLSWTVPAGAFAYEGCAPVDVARLVADGAGAVLLSHPYDSTLLVRPRYPSSPWNWLSTSVDRQLLANVVVQSSGRVTRKPTYTGVVVQGDQQGVQVVAKRAGTDGSLYTAQVVDQLILTVPVATERARNVLSDRGLQTGYSMRLPLFPAPLSSGQPGLFGIGELTQYIEGATSWLAKCTGVTIEVSRDDRALVVWQTINLERHQTDAN